MAHNDVHAMHTMDSNFAKVRLWMLRIAPVQRHVLGLVQGFDLVCAC
jgi:hypothetical protein